MSVAPRVTDQEVQKLAQINELTSAPRRIPYQDFGYEERMCHLSSKHHALQFGES